MRLRGEAALVARTCNAMTRTPRWRGAFCTTPPLRIRRMSLNGLVSKWPIAAYQSTIRAP